MSLHTSPIVKADDVRQTVYGWASCAVTKEGTVVVDDEGDIIDIADLEAAMHEYCAVSGQLNFDHVGKTRGRLIECVTFTPEKLEKMGVPAGILPQAAWVGFHLPDRGDYERARDGGMLAFSIEGVATKEEM